MNGDWGKGAPGEGGWMGVDDELGTLEITMDAIRQASQVRGEGRGVSGEGVAERAP